MYEIKGQEVTEMLQGQGEHHYVVVEVSSEDTLPAIGGFRESKTMEQSQLHTKIPE